MPSKFGDITYTLDDDEEEEKESEDDKRGQRRDKNGSKKAVSNDVDESDIRNQSTEVILPTRTRLGERGQDTNTRMLVESELKGNQTNLLNKKLEELRKRYKEGNIAFSSKKQRVKDMGKI